MDELRAGKAMVVGRVTVIPIEHLLLQTETSHTGGRLVGAMAPYAIVVCQASGVRAFDVQAAEVPVNDLVREVPGLEAVLAPLSP